MASLAKLLADHGSLLVLDAASTAVQAGLLRTGADPVWAAPPGDAGTALFAGADSVLTRAGVAPDGVGAFVCCEGPGSMLGIRTVAMALRTWTALRPRPVFAYASLGLAAAGHASVAPGRPFAVIADARRDSWHCVEVDSSGRSGPLRRLATSALPAGELVQPENFRTWSRLDRTVAACAYDVGRLLATLPDLDLFRPVEAPDAFQHETPDYRRWTPQVHRAGPAPNR